MGAVVGALAIGGAATGVAMARSGGGDDQNPISGDAYERATAKALAVVGSGHVTETEQGDEESYYQVEVTKPDGSQVDVNLDERFNLVKTKAERETPGSEGDDGTD